MNDALCKVVKRLHYPLEVMLQCMRWYAAYPLSLRNLEEMMAARGVAVDHTTVHRWAVKMLSVPVHACIDRLSEQERHVILGDYLEDRRFVEIAVQSELTRDRVSPIHKHALKNLRPLISPPPALDIAL